MRKRSYAHCRGRLTIMGPPKAPTPPRIIQPRMKFPIPWISGKSSIIAMVVGERAQYFACNRGGGHIVRIMVVDDDPFVREVVVTVLGARPGVTVQSFA